MQAGELCLCRARLTLVVSYASLQVNRQHRTEPYWDRRPTCLSTPLRSWPYSSEIARAPNGQATELLTAAQWFSNELPYGFGSASVTLSMSRVEPT